MPRNPHTMPICSPEKTSCVLHSITTVEESAFEDHHSSNDCKCLPSCTTIEFPHETSSSKLHRADLINIPQEILGMNLLKHFASKIEVSIFRQSSWISQWLLRYLQSGTDPYLFEASPLHENPASGILWMDGLFVQHWWTLWIVGWG